jgi:hypothetical protein
MGSPKEQNFYEQLQLLEYISIAGILSIIASKVVNVTEIVAFTAYHLKQYIREGFSFYDVSKYDPICDFLEPPTIAKEHVTNLLQEVIKLQKIPNKDESKFYPLFHSIACHRTTLEKAIGFSLLTDKQSEVLTLDNTPKAEEQRFNDDTIRRFIILVARNEFFDKQGNLLSYSKIHTALEHKNPNGKIPAKNTIKRMLAE